MTADGPAKEPALLTAGRAYPTRMEAKLTLIPVLRGFSQPLKSRTSREIDFITKYQTNL
jgi:hypothetical protein